LRLAKVPVRYQTSLLSIEQGYPGQGLRATFRQGTQLQTVDVDAVCMNDGFEPQNEILRLLGAELRFDPQFGHFRCVRSSTCQTSVAQVYAVGDCCGLGGAPAAAAEGRIAGAAAAAACGFSSTDFSESAQRTLHKARRFQTRLWALHNPAPRALDEVPPETIVCRCEEVSLEQFRTAMTDGGTHIGALKLVTRVGMGCCQGRYCGPVAARLLAESRGQEITDHSHFAPRVPIKPVSIAALQATQEALDVKA
jgi:NAD(P)H-nitrite reductase large subunit